METIDSIINEMRVVIETNDIKPIAWWLDMAQKLAVLRLELKNELIRAEIEYKNKIQAITIEGTPYNKAKNIVEGQFRTEQFLPTAYEKFRMLQAKDEGIEEIIRISKKRASVISTFQ